MTRFLPAIALATLLLQGACSTIDNSCCEPNEETQATELSGETVRILSLNLAHGRGDSMNQLFVSRKDIYANLDRIAAQLEREAPDFAAFQEADDPSRWSGGFDHVQYLASQLDWPNYVHGTHADGWLFEYGTAIATPHELTATYVHDFPSSFPTTNKGFVTATLDWHGENGATPLTVLSAHLDFSRRSVREEQIDEMVAYLKTVDGPFIVAGDLNGDWRDGRSVVREIIDDLGLQVFRPDADDLGTYKSQDGKRLDWILISKDLEFVSYRVLPDIVSDHLTLIAEIRQR